MTEVCCEKFKEASGEMQSVSPLAMAYPERAEAQIIYDEEDKTWNVTGCCGGNCYVLTEIKFCPFCGAPLP